MPAAHFVQGLYLELRKRAIPNSYFTNLSFEIALEIPCANADWSAPVLYSNLSGVNVALYRLPVDVNVGSLGICSSYNLNPNSRLHRIIGILVVTANPKTSG